MSEKKTKATQEEIDAMFEKASTDVDIIGRVSDVIKTGRRWEVTHKEIKGDVIVVRSMKDINTRYGAAVLAEIDHEGLEKTCLLGGQVLMEQAHELENVLPVLAVIVKPARSYVFRDPTEQELTNYKKEYLS